MPATTDEILTMREVAALLKCARTTIATLCRTQGFPHFRIGTDYRFIRSQVDEWVAQQAMGVRLP
jgi:excisionase family DNA binding protein